tara:strand:- start:1180 stop:2115 length:936 start_codon:yes stop_codon:yes gene_type:complete
MTDQIEDQDVELDEDIEEAHDPKNAEAQSIASVDAAEKKGPKAAKRKGDKSNSQPSDLKPAGKTMKAENIEFNGDFSDDLNALVESEATLSDEFKAKTAVIFEAAVKTKLSEEINRLETEYQEQLDEEIQSTKDELVGKVDSYLDYVVEQWMKDNQLAVQSGLRAEIAEGFMNGLKDLFIESYVEIPESRVDLVDEIATAHEELEEAHDKAVADIMDLKEQLKGFKREAIIREAARGLADTQVEKLTSLSESVTYQSEEDFAVKVATLKESYFSQKTATSSIVEDTEGEDNSVEVSGLMADYVSALRKTRK